MGLDKELFARQVEENAERMYRIAYTILHNPDDCKDALQDAVLKAWEKRASLKREESFLPWLIRIVINNCYNVQRRRRRMVPLEGLSEPSVPPPDPTLSMALEALPDKLRLPLVLVYAEGMSYQEAAQALGLPLATLRGRVYRGKEQLRKELREE